MLEDPLRDAGAVRAQYEQVAWAATPLGPVSGWSPALRSAVDLAVHTRFPMTLLWGPELVLVYNDAFVQLIAEKHPAALGAPARDVFPEVWDTIGPMLRGVLAGDGPTWVEDARLPLRRRGFLEECYFTFSYSPAHGADGRVEGVVDIATETTRSVLDRRRLGLLAALAERLQAVAGEMHEVVERALPLLRAARDDLAAVEIRLAGAPGEHDPRLPAAPGRPLHPGELRLEPGPAGTVAWLPLDGDATAGQQPVLVVLAGAQQVVDDGYRGFLRLLAEALGRALDRVVARRGELRAAAAQRDIAVTLQRSLLPRPVQPADVEVAVRYQAAAEQAQVGGDWYDAFWLPDGALAVVVGDVAGHDRHAAAAMGQVRNLLRGVAHSVRGPVEQVLTAVDAAMHGLAEDVVATAVVAVRAADAGPDGDQVVSWSNAGHPPPALVAADGSVRLLETAPDLLLGLLPDTPRQGHTVPLPPGSSLLLYTDGLLERRDASLREGLAALVGLLHGRQGLSAEQLCDLLLDTFGGTAEDDVALLVLRVPGPAGDTSARRPSVAPPSLPP